jgi:hypothetical protein
MNINIKKISIILMGLLLIASCGKKAEDVAKSEDLKDENGLYWSVSGDLSFMYPMAEMSGIEHYKFMKDINYIYNEHNPLNDHKVNMGLVSETTKKIRKMKPYDRVII